jgi:PAS domain S-box-containing protein
MQSRESNQTTLTEAEETIRAIYSGEVDALVVKTHDGPKVFTLEGADHPYRVIVEQMHDGTVTLDKDHVILYANPKFSEMTDTTPAQVTGSRFESFLLSGEAEHFTSLVEAALDRGHTSGEINLRVSDNTTIPVRLSITHVDVAGLQMLSVLATDLREERRNQDLVREEQLSRLILEQAGEGIVVIDPQGVILRSSTSARNLAGRPTLLNHFDEVFPLKAQNSAINVRSILQSAQAGERMNGIEATMIRADHHQSSLLVSTSPLLSPIGELLGCVVTLTDISERRLWEDALTRQADELAKSNNDLRQFAYSASHDLREPVRQIAVLSELLHAKYREKLDPEANKLIERTVRSAHRMEKLLTDLFAYTQAADAPRETTGPVDANEIIQKTLAMYEVQIAECGARVECDPLPLLDVHEVHLTQIFQNLIGNAIKYRSEAPLVIRISAESDPEMCRIQVADNGIGVDPHYQRSIFGLFQRLHGEGKYSGSGMGLAICQRIVQRYGGAIWVESEPGRGSRFIFTLPGAPRARSSAKP